jgi:hypothetical protein
MLAPLEPLAAFGQPQQAPTLSAEVEEAALRLTGAPLYRTRLIGAPRAPHARGATRPTPRRPFWFFDQRFDTVVHGQRRMYAATASLRAARRGHGPGRILLLDRPLCGESGERLAAERGRGLLPSVLVLPSVSACAGRCAPTTGRARRWEAVERVPGPTAVSNGLLLHAAADLVDRVSIGSPEC